MSDNQLGLILWAIGLTAMPKLIGLIVMIAGILILVKGIAEDAP